ncbi:MAG: hypothetical protein K6U11_00410 [bacterium]|nr:hypothetical protein [bacterium]
MNNVICPCPSFRSFREPYTARGLSEDASWLQESFDKILSNLLEENITIGASREKVLKSLKKAFAEYSTDNWDGYGAKAVDRYSYYEAQRFINVLPITIPVPEVAVDPDGEISFEWYAGPRKVFTVSIGKNRELTYAGLFGSNKIYGTEHFEDFIPKIILENIQRVFL